MKYEKNASTDIRSDAVAALLREVEVGLAGLRLMEEKYAAQLAPRFYIFDYLRNDEMGISRCLADLFDPAGRHGQKRIFLDAFLALLPQPGRFTADVAAVDKEHAANRARRIDIHIEFRDGALLAIENKPWAADQKNQLRDYARFLKNQSRGKPWLLVYLCNGEPSEESIGEEEKKAYVEAGNLAVLNFSRLCDSLEVGIGRTRALPVQVFVQELVKFIRRNINWESDMSMQNELVKIVMSNEANVLNAMEIARNAGTIRVALMNKLKRDLESELLAGGEKFATIRFDETVSNPPYRSCWGDDGANPCSGWNFLLDVGGELGQVILRFEFYRSGYSFFFWGIPTFGEERGDRNQEKAKKVFDLLEGQRDNTVVEPWWPAWANINDQVLPLHWGADAGIWARIQRGPEGEHSVVGNILERTLRIRNALAETPYAG